MRHSLTLPKLSIHCEDIHKVEGKKTIQLQLHARGDTFGSMVHSLGEWLLWLDVRLGKRVDEVLIHESSTAGGRNADIDQKHRFEQIVEGHPVQDGARPELSHVQERKHNPVSQQLRVIFGGRRLERNQRVVAWHNKTGNVRQQLANACDIQEDQQEVDANAAQNKV